jgi:hypothetical protein
MALPPSYRIVPPIGVARVGDADADTFFIGPEYPGYPPEGASPEGTAVPPFKDGGKIKPQAARFRIWEYVDNGSGSYTPSREIDLDTKDIVSIDWTVHLANKKAAFFEFSGLLGDVLFVPRGPAPPRRNAGVADRKKLWIDPGPRSIGGKSKKGVEFKKGTAKVASTEHWPAKPPTPAIEYLGELRTDAAGRLIVIGGKGTSGKSAGAAGIGDYANNDGWYDDVSDGPVTATLRFKGGPVLTAAGAWVLVGPPDFAPYAENTVTLFDVLVDMAARSLVLPPKEVEFTATGAWGWVAALNAEMKVAGRTSLSSYKPSFDLEIWPILRRASASDYLFKDAVGMHYSTGGAGNYASMFPILSDPAASNGAAARLQVFKRLRAPADAGDGLASQRDMPRLLGDDPYTDPAFDRGVTTRRRLALTPTMYAILEQWNKGNFIAAAHPPGRHGKTISPAGLTQAALQAASGGAFFPGIEVSWQIRHPALFAAPFRIKHGAPSKYIGERGVTVGPGHFSRQMALPWQADFLQCKTEKFVKNWGWWPAQRPDNVYKSLADAQHYATVENWHRPTSATVTTAWATGFPRNTTPPSRDTSMPSYDEMLANWTKFGFIHESGDDQFEDERARNVP